MNGEAQQRCGERIGIMIVCDAIKQNESEVEKYNFLFFWDFLLGYCLGFNLVKTP